MSYRLYTKQDIASRQIIPRPGDFIVTHGNSFYSWLIRIATRSHWNHAALVVARNGTIIEATGKGLRKNTIDEYPEDQFHLVRVTLSDADRQQAVSYAQAMLARHAEYDFLAIASIGLKIITHSHLVIKIDGTLICSEFVAEALAEGGTIWYKDTSLITPADLYNRFVRDRIGATDKVGTQSL